MEAITTEDWRPDVAEFLDDILPIPGAITERSRWRIYASYQETLCAICGWDAHRMLYDQSLYQRAHAEMMRRLGI